MYTVLLLISIQFNLSAHKQASIYVNIHPSHHAPRLVTAIR